MPFVNTGFDLRRLLSAGLASLFSLTMLSGCAAMTEHSTGIEAGRLTDCPSWPRCVSSQAADADKMIAPLRVDATSDKAWQAVKEAVATMPRTAIVEADERYLHAEVVSPWHFYTDDLELLREPAAGVIHIRSSGRIGYYDFQVNRDRVENVRGLLKAQGLTE